MMTCGDDDDVDDDEGQRVSRRRNVWTGLASDLFVLLRLLPPPAAAECLPLQPVVHERVQGLP